MQIGIDTTLADYRNLIISAYKKRYITTLAIACLASYAVTFYMSRNEETGPGVTSFVLSSLLVCGYICFSVNSSIKKGYKSNRRLHEHIIWQIEGAVATISGTSFTSTLNMDQCHKIMELKNWFLLYENNTIFHFIPKNALSTNEIHELRSTLQGLTGVPKVSLRKD